MRMFALTLLFICKNGGRAEEASILTNAISFSGYPETAPDYPPANGIDGHYGRDGKYKSHTKDDDGHGKNEWRVQLDLTNFPGNEVNPVTAYF